MEGIIIVIVLVLIGALIAFVSIKINNLKYRAKQHVLGKVGLGAADVNASVNSIQEQMVLKKFFNEYPNISEKQIKDTLYSFSNSIINLQNNGYMNDKVISKMQTDKLLEKMRSMNFVRINILGYGNNKISAVSVYTDGRDEYQITMMGSITSQGFYLEHFDSMRGITKGF